MLDSRKHICIERIIADIVRGASPGLEVTILAARIIGVLLLGAALDAIAHLPSTIGTLEKPGENLRLLVFAYPAAAGHLLLHRFKNFRIDNRLMGSLNPQPLFLRGTNNFFVLIGDRCLTVVNRVADIGFIPQNVFDVRGRPCKLFSAGCPTKNRVVS